MMQVLIYVGAVAVTISFAIMLAAPEEKKRVGHAGPLVGPVGFATAALLAGGFSDPCRSGPTGKLWTRSTTDRSKPLEYNY